MTALQQREQTFKETPHKARLTALCGVSLVLRQHLAEQWQMTFSCFRVPRFPAAVPGFPVNCLHNLSVLDFVTKIFLFLFAGMCRICGKASKKPRNFAAFDDFHKTVKKIAPIFTSLTFSSEIAIIFKNCFAGFLYNL